MSSNHDDWVGAVAVYVELVLTDCENFINASHDQTDNMNSWKSQSNSVEQVTSCSEEV